jgi:hypothetical protein
MSPLNGFSLFFFRFLFSAKLVRTITFLSFEIGQWYLVCGCMTIRRCVMYCNENFISNLEKTRKNCFRYLKLMSPLNAAICTTISYTWVEWYYLKNNYLTLRSKVNAFNIHLFNFPLSTCCGCIMLIALLCVALYYVSPSNEGRHVVLVCFSSASYSQRSLSGP